MRSNNFIEIPGIGAYFTISHFQIHFRCTWTIIAFTSYVAVDWHLGLFDEIDVIAVRSDLFLFQLVAISKKKILNLNKL